MSEPWWQELEAGSDLNAMVAQKVMGRVDMKLEPSGWVGHPPDWKHPVIVYSTPPGYSTDITTAMKVVEHERARWNGNLRVTLQSAVDGWTCDLVALTGHGRQGYGVGETLPLAICRAALAACHE